MLRLYVEREKFRIIEYIFLQTTYTAIDSFSAVLIKCI